MNLHPVITIADVSKAFPLAGFKSVDGMSFTVRCGEKFGIFGPNGAGKTTLISMLCGLQTADEGSIRYHVGGKTLQVAEVLGKIGYVPQEYSFFEELSPQQNLAYFGALHGIPKTELKNRIAELLAVLGLETVAKKKVRTFSGGMKRRVNLAIGLVNNPEILFLDEPTVGVDVQSKMAIMHYLEALNAAGTTIVYTSHHLKEAESFCDRILLMDAGRMLALNELGLLLEEHETADLEAFFIKLTGAGYRDR